MISWLKSKFNSVKADSKPDQKRHIERAIVTRKLKARYDAAQTTDNNRRYWVNADGLSANAANSTGIRRTLRNRSRYEYANNTYFQGIANTLANDTIGTGPRLQLLSDSESANKFVNAEFAKWAKCIGLPTKFRTMRTDKCVNGESFGIMHNDDSVDEPVKLNFRLYEADQCDDYLFIPTPDQPVSGITLDKNGKPISYKFLKQHPGDVNVRFEFGSNTFPANQVLHYYRADRAGQVRGVPEFTSALPLFAMLRDYTLATLDAAKAAAYFAAVLQTTGAAGEDADQAIPFDTIELERGMLTTMPEGYQLGQVKAEQPTTTYSEFKKEVLNEIARCANVPFNIAAGNSSSYNYASGRMDHQVYFKSVKVEQYEVGLHLDRLFGAWMDEAQLIEGYLPPEARNKNFDRKHQWFFDGAEHVDPAKEANAQETRLRNYTTTLAHEYSIKGLDWRTQVDQRAIEIAYMKEKGLPLVEEKVLVDPDTTKPSNDAPQGEEESEEDDAD